MNTAVLYEVQIGVRTVGLIYGQWNWILVPLCNGTSLPSSQNELKCVLDFYVHIYTICTALAGER